MKGRTGKGFEIWLYAAAVAGECLGLGHALLPWKSAAAHADEAIGRIRKSQGVRSSWPGVASGAGRRSRSLLAMLLLAGLVLASVLALQSSPQRVEAAAGWHRESAPAGLPSDGDGLAGVWGASASDVYAVTGGGILIHYDGSAWVSQGRIPMDSPDGVEPYISDIWGASSDLFVLGGVNWHEHSVFHRSGGRWTQTSIDNHDGSYSSLWGSSSRNVFAVGGCDIGIINHYDGASWQGQMDPDEGTTYLSDVWGSSASDVYAVGCGQSQDSDTYEYGYSSAILHFDGTGWSTMARVAGTGLSAIWGSSASNVFAVGYDGAILHYDGRGWSSMASGAAASLSAVWGSSGSDVYAVGAGGAILHYDGRGWSSMASGTAAYLDGVWGSGSEVFAVGEDGTILHYGAASAPPAADNRAPAGPANVSPAHGAAGVVATPVLRASAFSDPDGDGHAASSWQVRSAGGSYSSPVWQATGAGATGITVPAGELKHIEEYYWRVRYQDGRGLWSPYSAETSFTTADFVYADRPANISPANGASGVSLTPVLQASSYYHREGHPHAASSWQVRSSGGSYDHPVWESGLGSRAASSITVPAGELRGSTRYYWRVGYQDSRGLWSKYSEETSFTTAYVPGDTDQDNGGTAIPDNGNGTVNPDNSHGTITPDETLSTPVVITLDALSVTGSSAQLAGQLQSLGGAGSVAVSFVWGTTAGGPYTNATVAVTRSATGSFQADLSDLASGRTFYYQARATADSTGYGVERSFVTASTELPTAGPAVSRLVANSGRPGESLTISITGANLGGATAVSFGAGIVVDGFRVVSDTEVTSTISIGSGAGAGARDVTVTSPGGTGTARGAFQVEGSGSPVSLWAYGAAGAGGLVILGILGYLISQLRRPAR